MPNPDGDHFEAVMWAEPQQLANHPAIRHELAGDIAQVQSALLEGRTIMVTPS